MTTPEPVQKPKGDVWPPDRAPDVTKDDCASTSPEGPNGADLLKEILTSVYRAEGMTAQGFAMLRERMELLEQRLLGLGAAEPAERERPPSAPPAAEEETSAQKAAAEHASQSSAQPPVAAAAPIAAAPEEEIPTFPELPPEVAPPAPLARAVPVAQPVPQPAYADAGARPANVPAGDVEGLLFGSDLASHPALAPQRQSFLQALRQGDEDALGLAGQILIVRSATMDRLPTLLKDVGEAWYRWRREDAAGAGPLRDALIAWLHARLDAAGLGNRIELVRVGDRYDSKRHNAKARGVEVTGVHGWVVLRDNGNVYTKATVSVA